MIKDVKVSGLQIHLSDVVTVVCCSTCGEEALSKLLTAHSLAGNIHRLKARVSGFTYIVQTDTE